MNLFPSFQNDFYIQLISVAQKKIQGDIQEWSATLLLVSSSLIRLIEQAHQRMSYIDARRFMVGFDMKKYTKAACVSTKSL